MKECPACRRCFPDDVNHCPNDGDALTHSIMGEPVLDGRYQLERRLGQGGMGVVFQARHIFLKTSHAIKVILPDLVGNDPMLVTRFRQEAMAAAAIHHQNIIAVTDFGVARGTMPFLVMEFVQGRSLHEILAQEKRLTPERALELMAPICAGIAAAHRQKIVHRDLKPLNIMLQDELPPNEGLKVLDFGLAKIKSGELLGSFVQAKTSGLMGSPFYMAPEQWSDEEPDARADIYSLGVLLYQMLGGDVPFKGNSVPSIMKKHLTEPPPPLRNLGANVPPQVEAVVRHALEKERDARPHSVVAFLEELREAIAAASSSLYDTQSGIPLTEAKTFIAVPPPPPREPEVVPEVTTTVHVSTEPPQSRVFINGISVGVSDEGGVLIVPDIPGGLHRVRVVHEGYADWEQRIDCSGGECNVSAQLHVALAASRPRMSTDSLTGQATGSLNANTQQRQQPTPDEVLGATSVAPKPIPAQDQSGRAEGSGAGAQEPRPLTSEHARQASSYGVAAPPADPGSQTSAFPPPGGATLAHLGGGSTQSMGDNSLEVAGLASRQGQTSPAAAVPETARRKSSLPLIAAVVVILLLAGGGVGAYFMLGPSTVKKDPGQNPQNGTGSNREQGNKTQAPKAELIEIPGGTFQMGRDGGTAPESPVHTVTVASFAIDKTEVTSAEYADFVRDTNYVPPPDWVGGKPPTGQEQAPVTGVSFEDAQAFAAWRSKRDSVKYRLPTEEEWEFAARNGEQGTVYPWGNKWVDGNAVTKEAGAGAPAAVGTSRGDRTKLGVEDMLGNVREWTSSRAAFYPGSKLQVPPQAKSWVVVRGGSFVSGHDDKQVPISGSYRDWFQPTTKHQTFGFRLVRVGQ
ncbi:MAG TPA: SUMF1/EgtB/PvdO family nonheme iron enzyme [Pyrinomonadaceae bacterium]|jgi:serine/threonine-protein kinase